MTGMVVIIVVLSVGLCLFIIIAYDNQDGACILANFQVVCTKFFCEYFQLNTLMDSVRRLKIIERAFFDTVTTLKNTAF